MKNVSFVLSKILASLFPTSLVVFFALASFGQSTTSAVVAKTSDYSYFKGGTVSVFSSSHQDIAWMDSIGRCIEFRDKQMITPVLERLKKNSQFKFSVEDALCLREYLHRHPESIGDILKYTREGRLDWGATYNQPYESMYDGEALIRQTYLGRKWLKKTLPGCDFKTSWSEDVPGRSLQMAQILSRAGIPYLQFSRHQPGIYNWHSPDGSYVTCYTPGQYDESGIPVRKADTNTDSLTKAFTAMLTNWNGYYAKRKLNPEFPFLYSHDFATPPDYDAFFTDWNSKSPALKRPLIKYATGTEWFKAATKGNPPFDKISGERPDVWLYIHGPSHQKALKASREGSRLLTAAEKFATFDALQKGSFENYPQAAFAEAWENAIYPDHGWGGKHGDLTDRAFRSAFEKGRSIASDIVNVSMNNIAARIHYSKPAIPIVVFNALSWARTDQVKFTLNVEGNDNNTFRLIDEKGIEIPYQLIDEHQITNKKDEVLTFLFIAENVPSVGYKTYYLEKSKPATYSNSTKNTNSICENSFYKVEFADGGIKSLYDKELSKSLLNSEKFLGAELFTMQSVGNGAGEFTDVQLPTMEGFEKLSDYHQPWTLVSSGPVRDVYQFTKQINHVTVMEQVILFKTIKRIDIHVELKGFDGEQYREFRLAFPVNQDKPEIAYAVPMGVVRVGKDEIAGAAGYSGKTQIYDTPCRLVHPREVQDWFSSSDATSGITISSDVAVFDWNDPTTNPATNTILQPVLLASRKSCHGEGNFYLQPGDHTYTFSFYSHAGDWKNGFRNGTQSNQPLMAVTVNPELNKGMMPETLSFISVENKNLLLSTVKKCDDDNQVIVRCYDIEGKDSEAKISLFKPYQKAEVTNLIEEEGKAISGDGNTLLYKVGHHAIETLKLEVK